MEVEAHLKRAPPAETIMYSKGETVQNPKFSTWKDRDLLLRSWITSTLSEEALCFVFGCDIAEEVWGVLEENLLQATKDREIQLKQQMQDLKLKHTATI